MTRSLVELLSWRRSRWLLAAPVVAWGLWACTSHPLESPVPSPKQQSNDHNEITVTVMPKDLDILFMIDNSSSTTTKQTNLKNNFPVLIDELGKGGLPNARIAVVTSDMGAGGVVNAARHCESEKGDAAKFQVTNVGTATNCGISDGRLYIETLNGAATNLAAGKTLATTFSCMATRGANGCGFEHQLKAVDVALNPRDDWNPENKDFLRKNAYLAIIMLTDEDDCSAADDAAALFSGDDANYNCIAEGHLCDGAAPPKDFSAPLANCSANPAGQLLAVQDIVNHIKALKATPDDKIIVAAIAGWPKPGQEAGAQYTVAGGGLAQVCTDAGGGTPALRVKAFVDAFKYGTIETICQNNFAMALRNIGALIKDAVGVNPGSPCVSAKLADADPVKAGLQPDCEVTEEVTNPATKEVTETLLPQCGSGMTPCWSLTADGTCAQSGYSVKIDRGGKPEPAGGVKQLFKCLTCAKAGATGC